MSFKISVTFHHEDGTWWAEAPEVPDYVAWADTPTELRALVKDGLEFRLERSVEIVESPAFDFTAAESAGAMHLSTSLASRPAPFSLDLMPAGHLPDLSGSALAEERVAS